MRRLVKNRIVALFGVIALVLGLFSGLGGADRVRANDYNDYIFDTHTRNDNVLTFNIDGVDYTVTVTSSEASVFEWSLNGENQMLRVIPGKENKIKFTLGNNFDKNSMNVKTSGTPQILAVNDNNEFTISSDIKGVHIYLEHAGGQGPSGGDEVAHIEMSSSPDSVWEGIPCVREEYYNVINEETGEIRWDYSKQKSWQYCSVSVNGSPHTGFGGRGEEVRQENDASFSPKTGEDAHKLDLTFSFSWSFRPDEIISINGHEYNVAEYLDFDNEQKWLDAFAFEYQNQDISLMIPDVEVEPDGEGVYNLSIVIDLRPITDTECFVGNFLWRNNAEGADSQDDLYVGNASLELISATYPERLQGTSFGKEVLDSESRKTKAEKTAKYITYGISEESGIGEMVLPVGTKVTMRIVPEFGYQVQAFKVNGFPIEKNAYASGGDTDVAYYTFTIEKANFHLGAEVVATPNEVEANNSKAVSGGSVTLGGAEDTMQAGTAKLEVGDIKPSDEQVSKFTAAAGDYNIADYVDISLFNTIYKGNKDNGSWDTKVDTLQNPATISLDLKAVEGAKSAVIVHEKSDGTYETLDADYDDKTGTVTFATSSFSNYAIAYSEAPAKKHIPEDAKKDVPEGYDMLFRMYNPNSGEHFYTTSRKEGNTLVDAGWTYEGDGWIAPKDGDPVYRMYNPNSGDHHYTMSKREKNKLVEAGWNYEGIGWHSEADTGKPLYRLYNPNAQVGQHHYTASTRERDALTAAGWNYEGLCWYGHK